MPKKNLPPGGRPPFNPTMANRLLVRKLASMGWSHDKIAEGIGCSDETLRKYFRYELDMGNIEMCSQIEATLLEIATDKEHRSAVAAATVLLKAKGGSEYRETKRTEITGADGGPLQTESVKTLDSDRMSMEDREALRRILQGATEFTEEEGESEDDEG